MRKPHELFNLTCCVAVVSLCQTFHAYAYQAPSLEDTCKYIEEELKKNPDDRLLRFSHMQNAECMNKHSSAREDATILVHKKATTQKEYEQNYAAYIVLGDTEKALSCLDMSQKLWPNRDYYKLRGSAYARAGEWKTTLQNYQEHWRRTPSDYIILPSISLLQDKLGERATAAASRSFYERLDKTYHDTWYKKFRELCRASGPHYNQRDEEERMKVAAQAASAAVLQQISKYQRESKAL